jgi:hypothetical protein
MVKKKLPPPPSRASSPASKSASSAAKQGSSGAKPPMPAGKHALPPAKPGSPAAKHALPAARGGSPAAKIVSPASKLTSPAAKPAPPLSKLRRSGTARIVKKGGPAPHVLFIVATDQLRVYQHLEQEIAKLKNVELITDRRRKPRRQREVTIAVERRGDDRRKRPDVEKQLRQLGWSLVRTVKIPPS